MTDWPALPPDDETPVPGRVFVDHIRALHKRIDRQHHDAQDIRAELSGISHQLESVSAQMNNGFAELRSVKWKLIVGAASVGTGSVLAAWKMLQPWAENVLQAVMRGGG